MNSLKGIPAETNTLVACSHERPKGDGFPAGLSAENTFPLACAFNTCHTFIDEFYLVNFDTSKLNEIFSEMNKTFNQGNYSEPFSTLKNIIVKA